VAMFIRWAIVLLTNHVPVQERLHTEIDSVIGRQRLPALDDRSKSVNEKNVKNSVDLIDQLIIGYYYYYYYTSVY